MLVKHISCDSKCKFDGMACNSNQKLKNGTCQCEFNNYQTFKKDYSWNPSPCNSENGKYLGSISDDSKSVCDEIINVTNSISTNVLDVVSINSDCKIGCDILHTV